MTELEQVQAAIRETARANGARLALLFGSWARRTATKRSDVDVLFVEETSDRFLDRLDRYLRPLSERLSAGVDVLVYTPAEFEALRQRPFVARALREGEILHESGALP